MICKVEELDRPSVFCEAFMAGEERERERQEVRVTLLISGWVQGVAFRAYTQVEARSLGLSGWVRNLPDGTVQVLAEGPRDKVEALMDWCRRGPPAAEVDGVEATWEEPRGDVEGFRIRR